MGKKQGFSTIFVDEEYVLNLMIYRFIKLNLIVQTGERSSDGSLFRKRWKQKNLVVCCIYQKKGTA
jgi:hypothetical protein